jgi:hypothetical protein
MPTNDTTPTTDNDAAPTTDDADDPASGWETQAPSERPELRTTVDVRVPTEIADVVAQRAARRSTHEGAVTSRTITELADDYVQVWARHLVADTNTRLPDWIDEDRGVPVDHSEQVSFPDRQLFAAGVSYRPESEVPLHVTLDPPERVLEQVGGWEELVENARFHHAGEDDDGEE